MLTSGLLASALWATACGDDDGDGQPGVPDAAPASDAADTIDAASTIDAAVAAGVVNVVISGYPLPFESPIDPAGLPVLFFGPDGSLLAEEETDSDGTASAEVVSGTTVVALLPDFTDLNGKSPPKTSLMAFGVGPGDTVHFESAENQANPDLGTMTITFPGDPPAGTVSYQMWSCSSTQTASTTAQVDVRERCLREGQLDVLVVAYGENLERIGYTWDRATFAADGELAMDGAWVEGDTFTLTDGGVPPGVEEVEGALTLRVGPREIGDWYDVDLGESAVVPPSGFGATRVLDMYLEAAQYGAGNQFHLHYLSPETNSFDSGALETLEFFGSTIYQPESRSLTWLRTSGDASDMITGAADWETDEAWGYVYFVAPPESTDVVLPILPPAHSAYLPEDAQLVYHGVSGMEFSWRASYSEALAEGMTPDWDLLSEMKVGDRFRVAYGASGGIARAVPERGIKRFRVAPPRRGTAPTIP